MTKNAMPAKRKTSLEDLPKTARKKLARLCAAWLLNCHKFANHIEGCQCHSCKFAREFMRDVGNDLL